MKKLTLIGSLIALIGMNGLALAQSATPASGPAAKARPMGLDKDGDHLISRDEAKSRPMLNNNFDAIDTNKDGKLSPDEIKAFHDQHKDQRHTAALKKLDTNGDGQISRDEAKGHPMLEKNFDAIDTNKDGLLSVEELKAARQKQRGMNTPDGKGHPAH